MSERKLLVVNTQDVHSARVGGMRCVGHDENGPLYEEASREVPQRFLPESEAHRLAAAGVVMILKDTHGQEITQETPQAAVTQEIVAVQETIAQDAQEVASATTETEAPAQETAKDSAQEITA